MEACLVFILKSKNPTNWWDFINFLQIHSIQKIADIVTIIEKGKIFDAGKFFFDNMMHKSYEWIVKMINIEQPNWLVKLSNLLEC